MTFALLLHGACDAPGPVKDPPKAEPAAAKAKTSPGPSATADTPSDTPSDTPKDHGAAPPTPAQPLEPGWVRVELSSLSPKLSGSIAAPAEHKAVFEAHDEQDEDGLTVDGLGARLGSAAGGATLRAPAIIPPRFASAEAMLAFHKQFEHVSTHAFSEGHWAVVQQWRPNECMLHGWSAKAGLTCDVFKAPCDDMDTWVKTCKSLEAGAKPNASITTPQSAFPGLKPAAAAVAMQVARGVARNDSSLLLATLGPGGVRVGKKTYTPDSFEKARAEKTVAAFVAPGLVSDDADPGTSVFQWNTDAPPSDAAEATVLFSAGYGEVPFFTLQQTGETWHLTAFGVLDLGDP